MRPGDPRAGLSHARPGPTDPQPCGAKIRSGKHMVEGRKGRAGGSKHLGDPGSCFHGNGGGLSSLKKGLPSRDCPAQRDGEAPVYAALGPGVSGRAGRG